jgi:F-type H+-transporting ATPase subunit delta
MSVIAIASRYAESLYSVINESDVDTTVASLTAAKDLFTLEDASKILMSPVMPKELKSDLIKYALDQVGGNDTVRKFFEVVIDSGRVGLIPSIEGCFTQLVDEAKGIKKAELISATEVEASELEKIKSLAEKKFDSKLEIETKIDEELLGGFLLNVGNKRIDLSLKSRLEALTATAAQ